ncbi:MAG TPA: TolC family protein [Pyrinomonadaceae bacterium]|nr:TolC family protein [Pyrinomonadaceae bacterium]
MLIRRPRNLFTALLTCALLVVAAGAAFGQAPAPSPRPASPTRAPGTQTQSPTTAPGTERPAPQAPPGAPVVPGVTTTTPQTPTAAPSATPPVSPTDLPPGSQIVETPLVEPTDPKFPLQEQRPLPPMPNMTRLGVTGDNTIPLSLNDAIKRALENNNEIEVARDDVRFAETQLRSLEGIFDPIFGLTPQIDKRITPQQSSLGGSGSSGTTTSTTYSLTPSLNKQFSRGGGNYNLNFENNHTNSSNTFNRINPFYSSNLSLTFTQPLLRNRSIDNNRRQIRIQKKRLEQSDADFRQRTIEVIAQVQRAYWELGFALRDQQNQLANLNLSRENLRRVEAQIAVGTKAPLERAEVQTELANRESALLVSVQNVSIAENNLKQLMFKDSSTPEWSAQLTPTDTPTFDTTPVNLIDALKEARDNRPELRRLRLQSDINKIDIQYFKNQTRPQIDLQSTLATTGLAGKDVSGSPAVGTPLPLIDGDPARDPDAFLLQQIRDIQTRAMFPLAVVPSNLSLGGPPADLIGGFGKDLSNLFSFKTRNVTVGLTIQIPFKNKTAEANLAGARIQTEQLEASLRSQDQAIEVDVRNSAQAVETSRRRVLAAREARANAELQLEGEQRLYQVGRSTTFILFQRENALTNARNLELRAETDYNKALADLQRATSTTLRANNVIVDTPTP